MKLKHSVQMVLLLAGLTLATSGLAAPDNKKGSATQYGSTTLFHAPPSPAEILAALGEQPTTVKHRGAQSPTTPPASDNAASMASTTLQPGNFRVAMPLTFDSGSSTLSAEAKRYVDGIAIALQNKPTLTVSIIGHTDAQGGTDNQALSRKRAEVVKQYLVEKHQIDNARLSVDGKGAAEPLNQSDPYADENRRVEFLRTN